MSFRNSFSLAIEEGRNDYFLLTSIAEVGETSRAQLCPDLPGTVLAYIEYYGKF